MGRDLWWRENGRTSGKVGEVRTRGSEGGGGKGDVEVRGEGGSASAYPSKGVKQGEWGGEIWLYLAEKAVGLRG